MKSIITLAAAFAAVACAQGGPLKNIRERREARVNRAEVVVEKDGAKKIVVRGNREAVVTKDKIEIRQAPAPKKN